MRGEEEGRGRSDGNVSTEEEEEEFVEVIPGMDEEESVIQPHHPTEVDDASETRKEKNGNQDRCEEADKASHPSYDNAEEGKELEGSPGRTDPSSSAPREELTERERKCRWWRERWKVKLWRVHVESHPPFFDTFYTLQDYSKQRLWWNGVKTSCTGTLRISRTCPLGWVSLKG